MASAIPSISKSCRPQLAFPSNPFVPLVQMPDLIFGLAILTLRKKSSNLAFAERLRVLPTDGRPIIHTLSDAEFATHTQHARNIGQRSPESESPVTAAALVDCK
jgi:hypothetical protein